MTPRADDFTVATMKLQAFLEKPVASKAEVKRPPKPEKKSLWSRILSIFTMVVLGATGIVALLPWG